MSGKILGQLGMVAAAVAAAQDIQEQILEQVAVVVHQVPVVAAVVAGAKIKVNRLLKAKINGHMLMVAAAQVEKDT